VRTRDLLTGGCSAERAVRELTNSAAEKEGRAMPGSHRDYLVASAAEAGVRPDQFRPVPQDEAEAVRERIRQQFGRAVLCFFWPPLGAPSALSSAAHQFGGAGGWDRLEALVPEPDELAWFVCEDWGGSGSLVFDATPVAVQAVLGNSHGFEFFVVSKRMDWLVGEEDHGMTFAVGEVVASRLRQLAGS
jgi:hypothetical protein